MAVVSIKKSYPGHARRVMFGIWSFLRQFMYYSSSSWWSMRTSMCATGRKGLDVMNKWPGETSREWGRTMQMTPAVAVRVDQI